MPQRPTADDYDEMAVFPAPRRHDRATNPWPLADRIR
jgi:hypothetical protein